jgi:hypothetical protein
MSSTSLLRWSLSPRSVALLVAHASQSSGCLDSCAHTVFRLHVTYALVSWNALASAYSPALHVAGLAQPCRHPCSHPCNSVTLLHALHCCLQVGGLADVVTSLAKAHQDTGTLVEIVLPKYDCANYGPIDQLRHLTDFEVAWNGKSIPTKAWCGVVEGLPVYMLEPQQPAAFFWRGAFYGQVGGGREVVGWWLTQGGDCVAVQQGLCYVMCMEWSGACHTVAGMLRAAQHPLCMPLSRQ